MITHTIGEQDTISKETVEKHLRASSLDMRAHMGTITEEQQRELDLLDEELPDLEAPEFDGYHELLKFLQTHSQDSLKGDYLIQGDDQTSVADLLSENGYKAFKRLRGKIS